MMGRSDPLRDPTPLIRRVYAYVAYRIGAGEEAEDVTGEVFERAVRYRKSYDASKAAPITWLTGIARRVIADRPERRILTPGDALPEPADPLNIAQETARRLDMRSAISRLPERDRELIALRFGADLTARQIADVVGLEPHAVEMGLSRAVHRLRGLVGDMGMNT